MNRDAGTKSQRLYGRLRVFATAQIAFSFVLLAAAAMLLASLVSMQTASTTLQPAAGRRVQHPGPGRGRREYGRYQDVTRRIGQLPGVTAVAVGTAVPWRDAGVILPRQFTVEGYTPATGEENPHARMRFVAPNFFAVLGMPVLAGRDFTDEDMRTVAGRDPVVIVSRRWRGGCFRTATRSTARSCGPTPSSTCARRNVRPGSSGGVADVDDENVVAGPVMTAYLPADEFGALTQRPFVHTAGDPRTLIPDVTRVIREISPEQPVERAATLEDVRAEVLAPERLNGFVLSGFAGVALLIAVVGIAGVLAFSVSARIREFGVRLAIGSMPGGLMRRVLLDGARILTTGIAAGALGGCAFRGVAGQFLGAIDRPISSRSPAPRHSSRSRPSPPR